MKAEGKIRDAYKAAGGHIIVSLELNEIGSEETLDKLMHEEQISVSMDKITKKRSLNANAYFWVLVDKMAKKLGVERWTMYLTQIYKYGCFIDCAVINRAIPVLEGIYRYTEIIEEGEMNGEPASVVRCFRGSSTYDTEEMSDLINGTAEDAKDLGIDVLPPDEIRHLVELWKGSFNEQI